MESEDVDARLAEIADGAGVTIGVAESLTGGQLSSRIARIPGAGDWYRGSVVAYATAVKRELLGVPDVPAVSEPSAVAMAEGAARVLGADVTIAVTGEAGPEPNDDVPVGTVWMAVHDDHGTRTACHRFDGDPSSIVRQTCDTALRWLTERLARD